jgi:hypothetical protein
VSLSHTPSDKRKERNVELGPLFSIGVVLVVYGLLRRRVLAAAGGLAAIVLDQRSQFGRSLKERARALSVQVVEDDRDGAVVREPERHAGAEDTGRDLDA